MTCDSVLSPNRRLPSLPDLLRLCAAGREEYATSAPEPSKTRLQGEADALYSAARLAEGDLHTAYALIPSWRWHEVGLPDPNVPEGNHAARATRVQQTPDSVPGDLR